MLGVKTPAVSATVYRAHPTIDFAQPATIQSILRVSRRGAAHADAFTNWLSLPNYRIDENRN